MRLKHHLSDILIVCTRLKIYEIHNGQSSEIIDDTSDCIVLGEGFSDIPVAEGLFSGGGRLTGLCALRCQRGLNVFT